MVRDGDVSSMNVEKANFEETLDAQDETCPGSSIRQALFTSIDSHPRASDTGNLPIAHLEQEISRIREENIRLNETVESLLNTVQGLRIELTESQRSANQAIDSLRAQVESAGAFAVMVSRASLTCVI